MRALVFLFVAVLVGASTVLAQINAPARQLFEAGQYEEALRAVAGHSDPAETYLAAQILLKLNQRDNAKGELSRLDQQDGVWRAIGASARALIDDDGNGALTAAEQAAAMAPDHFFAQYQLGLVKADREDWAGAAAALERASQIDPSFAYARYYAGLAYSRIKRADRTAAHFESFLKLAPKAPERPAVESIMRTLRGR